MNPKVPSVSSTRSSTPLISEVIWGGGRRPGAGKGQDTGRQVSRLARKRPYLVHKNKWQPQLYQVSLAFLPTCRSRSRGHSHRWCSSPTGMRPALPTSSTRLPTSYAERSLLSPPPLPTCPHPVTHLVGQAEDVCVVLREAAHSEQAVHGAAALVAAGQQGGRAGHVGNGDTAEGHQGYRRW